MSAPSRSGILAAGNFIVDHVNVIDAWPAQDGLARILAQTRHNGGGPYNVLKDLARLGARFPLQACGLIGDDPDGRWIIADCAAAGVDGSHLQTITSAPTSVTEVMSDRRSGRRTFFYSAGANARFAEEHVAFPEDRRVFYLGYLLLLDQLDAFDAAGHPVAGRVLAKARAAGMATALDCVSENSDRFSTVVAPVLPEVDLLFANDFEAERLTGISLGRNDDLNPAAVEAAARNLLARGVRRLACIHFPQGACAVSAAGTVAWQPAVALPAGEIAGTSGAGDAFAAGMLLGFHENWPLARALQLGVCAAAASLRHPGCSESVMPALACLGLGTQFGFVRLP